MKSEERIKQLFQKVLDDHGGNKAAAAASLDTNHVTFWGWVQGKRGLSKALLNAIDKAGAQITFPDQPIATIKRTRPLSPVEYVQGDGLVQVGVYGSAEAGKVGLEIFDLEPSRLVTILESYYRNGLIVIDVEGKSMEPTIKKGAVVGVVPVNGKPVEGEIYLIKRPHFGLLIKRVFIGKDTLILKSDNPEHPPIELPYEGYESDTIILGHVYWIMQKA